MILQANMHLGFNCKNLEKTMTFYETFFGCKEKFSLYYGDLIPQDEKRKATIEPELLAEWERLKDVKWIVYMEYQPGVFIELFNEVTAHVPHIPEQSRDLNFTHFAILVDDLQAFYQSVLEKGGEQYVILKPQPNVDRTYGMWLQDPDGNKMEVMQYTEYSMQLIGRDLPEGAERIVEEMREKWKAVLQSKMKD